MSLLLELARYSLEELERVPEGKSMYKSVQEIGYSRREGLSERGNHEYISSKGIKQQRIEVNFV